MEDGGQEDKLGIAIFIFSLSFLQFLSAISPEIDTCLPWLLLLLGSPPCVSPSSTNWAQLLGSDTVPLIVLPAL